jgi:hypothetical protein
MRPLWWIPVGLTMIAATTHGWIMEASLGVGIPVWIAWIRAEVKRRY